VGTDLRRILVLLAAALALLLVAPTATRAEGDADACVLCAGAGAVPCPTCAGKGRGAAVCDLCDGKGRTACRFRLEGLGERAEDLLREFVRHEDGRRPCPNDLCAQWTKDKIRCGLCAGTGQVRCVDCVNAQSACGACLGRAPPEAACLDCAGTGKLVCALCRNTEGACGQCKAKGRLKCPVCTGSKYVVQGCADCAARGRGPCAECAGVGKTPCAGCGGVGRVLVAPGDKAETSCKKCGGKGVFACSKCADGRATCPSCGGAKRVSGPCRACAGSGEIECRASGRRGFRAPEAEAASLLRPDAAPAAREAARTLLGLASSRARATADAAWEEARKVAERATKGPVPAALADALLAASRFEAAAVRCEKALEKLKGETK
jgi:hypothetical protein